MELPVRLQRIGAYAVAVDSGEILLSRISRSGFPPGAWALPGGRVEHGESPWDAVRRELWEETGLAALDVRLRDVHSVHTVGDGRAGAIEDYHGIHVLFDVRVDRSLEPRVMERDGTSDHVEWVPVERARRLDALPAVVYVLASLS